MHEGGHRTADIEAAEMVRRDYLLLVRQLAEPDPSAAREADAADGQDADGVGPDLTEGSCADPQPIPSTEKCCASDDNRKASSRGVSDAPQQPYLEVLVVLPLSAMSIKGV